ncbi:pentatricopeptide repeat-containing protein At3g14330-like [Asparagus officinalis]|uniref:pentatricopeptide repeat-containing protein At3g14330-like n=1 Tax=Asparagus officinalis TaxID=4686 RepID=UPI00098E0761|nr:pentatricopeptide repeat-containing protein At3g14330-like [Asparagus officinalis]
MYGKCGLVDKARLVFVLSGPHKGVRRDVVMWTSLLNAYNRNGMFKDVIRVFEDMLVEKTKPDEVVFLVVLSACGKSGNVAKGLELFELMRKGFALVPGPEHYGCVVDMLCKAGELDSAWKFVRKEGKDGSRFGVSVWGAILSASRSCGNVEVGKIAASKALDLEPQNTGIYMELSNLYAGLGMWEEIVQLREVMEERGLKKDVGFKIDEILERNYRDGPILYWISGYIEGYSDASWCLEPDECKSTGGFIFTMGGAAVS